MEKRIPRPRIKRKKVLIATIKGDKIEYFKNKKGNFKLKQ